MGERGRIEGAAAIEAARSEGIPIALVLYHRDALSEDDERVLERLSASGAEVIEEAERAMRRMSTSEKPPSMIAMTGGLPPRTVSELMEAEGLVLLLAGLRYPGNVGFILRAAEVAGAAGVVIANDWEAGQGEEADRIGMRASRFFSVLESEASVAFAAAREAGRRIVAFETEGTESPWENDWQVPTLAVIGGETEGLGTGLVQQCDAILRIPTRGFIPSYNVQAAAGMALGEWLRQTAAR